MLTEIMQDTVYFHHIRNHIFIIPHVYYTLHISGNIHTIAKATRNEWDVSSLHVYPVSIRHFLTMNHKVFCYHLIFHLYYWEEWIWQHHKHLIPKVDIHQTYLQWIKIYIPSWKLMDLKPLDHFLLCEGAA